MENDGDDGRTRGIISSTEFHVLVRKMLLGDNLYEAMWFLLMGNLSMLILSLFCHE